MSTFIATALLCLLSAQCVLAADCSIATVGQPHSNCWDIAAATLINVDQLKQYNPGLDCNFLALNQTLCVTPGKLPSSGPPPNDDGSCVTYTVNGDFCDTIVPLLESRPLRSKSSTRMSTYKWNGCLHLQLGQVICVSPGTPPPIPVNPKIQCGPESPGGGECPLNACCSPFGFCGITSEFCEPSTNGDPCLSNCGYATLPTCDGSQMTRSVGYYAGWAAKRSCNAVKVSQLDLASLTHVIYAFAVIKEDGTIGFDDSSNADRLKELVTKADTRTNVLVAVGRSANRATFIVSAKAFISTYKIAGIDIDFGLLPRRLSWLHWYSFSAGVLGGFEIADLLLEGDLMTFDDDDSRSAKAKWE
ncbi:hypothetical protein C8J57DRAFT_1523257 [Mycena rebaudengoi]|nr:hypothetical protein C8J57DRAFT_1523257 [Mycena rebaudengoi]